MKWRTIPFVRLLSPLLLGISLAISLNYSLPILATNLVLMMAYIFWIGLSFFKIAYTKRWFPGLYLFFVLLLTGYHFTILENDLQATNHFTKQQPIYYFGEVLSAKAKSNSIQAQIQILVTQDSCQDWHTTQGKILAYFPKQTIISAGEQILFKSQIKKIPKALNPNAFDYGNYIFFQHIHFQAYIPQHSFVSFQAVSNTLSSHIKRWQNYCIEVFQKYIPELNAQGIAMSLVLGYRDSLDEDVRQAYTNTGAIHVLAVSGLHVGMLCLILQFFLQKIPISNSIWKWIKLIITIVIIWIYVFFTGASASVLRAGLMFTLILFGNGLNESSNIYNTLAASAFCLLLFHPYLLFNVGFQLSYAAVLGIVYFHPKLYPLFFFQNKLADYCWNLTCVSLAAQITTLPISLYYFHQFPIYFFLSGLIVVPAAGLILGSGVCLIICSTLPYLANITGQMLSELIQLMNESIFYLAQLPFSTISGIYWPWWMIIIYFLSLISIAYFIEKKSNKWILVLLLLLFTACANWSYHRIQHQDQKTITIYASQKETIIECFDGSTSFAVGSSGLSPKPFNYATKNNHTAKNIQTTIHIPLDSSFQQNHFFLKESILQFYDKQALVLHPEMNWDNIPPLEYDFILIVNNPYISFQQLKKSPHIPLLIFDLSNSNRKKAWYKKECTKHGIPFYDIQTQGAWMFNLNHQ